MAKKSELVPKDADQDKKANLRKLIKAAQKESELRADRQQERIYETETAQQKAEEERDKAQKKLDKIETQKAAENYRSNQLMIDGGSSLAMQTLDAGEQALLDYLIDKFPSWKGAALYAKGAPPAFALLWYLIEVYTSKKTDSLLKKSRVAASNLLFNFGLLHLRQAFSDKKKSASADAKKLAQQNDELSAQAELTKKDLEAAKKLLKDNKIEFTSGEDDDGEGGQDNGGS